MDLKQESQIFFDQLNTLIETNKIQLKDHWNIDHACYRSSSFEDYRKLKEEFEKIGNLLVESEVNGRPIATYKLHEPLNFRKQKIEIIELPAPKKAKLTKRGFEHIEIVIDEKFNSIQSAYKNLKFDKGGLKKNFNQELEIVFGDVNIKFHHISLESVIRLETNASVFRALTESKVLEILHPHQPLVIGTFPLGVFTNSSDLDILMISQDFPETRKFLTSEFARFDNFRIREQVIAEQDSVIASFSFQNVEFEIFAQNLHPTEQTGFKHFFAEERLLKEKGDKFLRQVKKLKEKGEKTEPAFGKALGIKVDPYVFFSDPRLWFSAV
jgi:predicted metalloenzyme YecM